MRTCANCGAAFTPLDGRYKYCSDECYVEAHRRKCRENFRRRYLLYHEEELARRREYYAKKRQLV